MWISLLRVGSLLLGAIGLPLSLLLLAVAATSGGRIFAVAGLGASIAPLAFCLGLQAGSRAGRRRFFGLAAAGGVGWLGLTIYLAGQAPDGRAVAGARIQHRYPGGPAGGGGFSRFALGNLLPEGDQLLLAFHVAPCLDRLLTFRQARELAGLTRDLYAELEADRDFHALGSVLPVISGAAWRAGAGHALLYVPPTLDRTRPAPALVFLHGSGGSFKAYPWILSRLADELGAVLIVPSGGMGWWRSPELEVLLERVLRDAAAVEPLDPRRVHLLGLSNGGLGVSRAGRTMADRFASLTFLSPVIDEEATGSTEFADRWRGRPIHVLTGASDDRIPFGYVSALARQWRVSGAKVEFRAVAGANHFLIFRERKLVVEQLAAWLRGLGDDGVTR